MQDEEANVHFLERSKKQDKKAGKPTGISGSFLLDNVWMKLIQKLVIQYREGFVRLQRYNFVLCIMYYVDIPIGTQFE